MAANGTPVILRELSGDRREVRLDGAALPNRGVQEGGELRTVVTNYPGAQRSSVQVMGTEEKPIALQGWLRDAELGAAGAALDLREQLRRLYLGQRRIELIWGTTLVKRGFLKELELTHHRDADIEYRLRFDVDESDESEVAAPVPFAPQADQQLGQQLEQLTQQSDRVKASAKRINDVQAAL